MVRPGPLPGQKTCIAIPLPLACSRCCRPDAPHDFQGVNLIYTAGVLLVLSQLIGIYGLWTRKADLVFALIMVTLLVVAGILGGLGVYDKLA